MRNAVVACCLLACVIGRQPAFAAECPGNPDALGVSRTIAVDPTEHAHLGGVQYRESLPLNDKEIVLTFDDGPLPPHSGRVLDILASECVQATFFMVGRMAQAYPQLVRRVHAEGHTIANHSQNHLLRFHKMPVDQAVREIEDGFASLRSAVGEPGVVSDFFRIPGLLRQEAVEQYLDGRAVMTWSVDFMADDWRHISPREIVARALERIEARGRGILLLHDIQPATVLALPGLLHELKLRGYRIVHVVQAGPGRPKTATEPQQWVVRQEPPGRWPRAELANFALPAPALTTPDVQIFGITYRPGAMVPATLAPEPDTLRTAAGDLPAADLWSHGVIVTERPSSAPWAAPAAENFRYTRLWRPRAIIRLPRDRPPVPELVSAALPRSVAAHAVARPGAGRDRRPAAPQRPTGHQLQLSRPTADLRSSPPTELR